MAIPAEQVKALREATGAGMMDSKRALEATNGDLEKAKDWLRRKGIAKAGAKATRTAREGIIATYIHHNHQLGVLLELNSESDFFEGQAKEQKKPEAVIEKIIQGKMTDFYKREVLLDQAWAKDDKRTVDQMLKEAIAKLGENITISRFARFKVGEAS